MLPGSPNIISSPRNFKAFKARLDSLSEDLFTPRARDCQPRESCNYSVSPQWIASPSPKLLPVASSWPASWHAGKQNRMVLCIQAQHSHTRKSKALKVSNGAILEGFGYSGTRVSKGGPAVKRMKTDVTYNGREHKLFAL